MTTTAPATVPYDAVLDELEAEAIHIYRETAAAFKNPVLLYSIGKDSSVLLHLAVKAFADLLLGRVGILRKQVDCRHHHAGCAEAALQAVAFLERLLRRVPGIGLRKTLDRRDC